MKKIYVLDTSVCLTSANSLYSFKNNDIVIPIKVLEEIDGHKKRQDVVGSNARQTIRILDSLRQKGSLSEGVRLGKGKGIVKVINSVCSEFLPPELDKNVADNKIISCALKLTQLEPARKVILVSRDINMRVIANSLNIIAEDYECEHVLEDSSKLFTGSKDILIDDEIIDRFYNGEEIYLDKQIEKGLYPNQFVKLISNSSEKKTALSRFKHEQEPLAQVRQSKQAMWGVTPRNTEQRYALDLLLDPSVPIVSLVGRAGSGKSLLALCGGLEQVVGRDKRYTRLIVSKPIQPVGKEIGFLPGSLEEKMLPWLKPIQDNLQFLMGNDKGMMEDYMHRGVIEIEAISYIRGRSIANAYMIIEECFPYSQNINTENGKMTIGKMVSKFQKGEKIPKVLSYDENTRQFVYKKVKNAWSSGHRDLIEVKCSNRSIKCTDNHPFLVKDEGYVKAKDLKVGELLVTTKPKPRSQLLKSWNEDQEQVVLGSYLGDGSISNHGLNRYRLRVVHGDKQSGYCHLKSEILNCSVSHIEENGLSSKPANRFSTLMFGSKIDFDSNKKTCSSEILERLGPKGLAIWFMDDGSVFPNKNGARISTCSFDEESQKSFVKYFNLLGMENVYYKKYPKDDGYYYLIFNCEDYRKLSALIEPYVHPELSYKVFDPTRVGSYKWNSKEEEFGLTIVDSINLETGINKEVFDIEVEDLHNFVICSSRASKNNSGIVVHNCQNLTHHEIKTIITRVGENTKIVLTGDVEQIDNAYIDETSNGLSYAVEKFKPSVLSGHVLMQKGERSLVATLASEVL